MSKPRVVLATQDSSRRPRNPRSKEPHIEIILRTPTGEKVGLWSPWAARLKALALIRKIVTAKAATPTPSEGGKDA